LPFHPDNAALGIHRIDNQVDKPHCVLGIMSGTSLDGVDVAKATIHWDFTHNQLIVTDIAVFSVPMPTTLRTPLLALQADGTGNQGTLQEVAILHKTLGGLFAEAVEQAIAHWHLPLTDILCIGSHGQTVYHQPPNKAETTTGVTMQLGDLSVMASRLNRPIIGDFRGRDMAVSGQGAPLVPFFDALFFANNHRSTTNKMPHKCIQNMGGIGNVTVLTGQQSPLAFDTGPGNMLIDGAMQALYRQPFDTDGRIGASGKLIPALLEQLQRHPFLAQHPPKSTGREAWGAAFLTPLLKSVSHYPPEDCIATLTAFTAWSVIDAYARFVLPNVGSIDEIIPCGGGAYNPTLIGWMQHWLRTIPAFQHANHGTLPHFSTTEDYALPNMAKEAVAFALLAWARWFGLPNNIPSCTGANQYVSMGHIVI
jgi:anhydro-N-acetylmuramic acid kinase